jgi:hypothetical protein
MTASSRDASFRKQPPQPDGEERKEKDKDKADKERARKQTSYNIVCFQSPLLVCRLLLLSDFRLFFVSLIYFF